MREFAMDEIRDKLLSGSDRFYLVDALTRESYAQRHLPGALNLPASEIEQKAAEVLPEKDAEVIVYCKDAECGASTRVARWLEQHGYSRVGHYGGGLHDWAEAELTFDEGSRRSLTPEARTRTVARSPQEPRP